LGLDPDKTHVLHNGVDLLRFQPRSATGYLHRELGLPGTAMLIGCIGQVGLRKGMDVLLEAMPDILRVQPGVHLLIVGRRYSQKAEAVEYERRLRQTAARGPLAGHCHFLGVRGDVDRLLPEWTLLVHAARQEPLGRVLLEAAACGLPTVATDVGGTCEIFPPGSETALLVPAEEPTGLAEAVVRLLQDPSLRKRIGGNARRRAENAFAATVAAQNLIGHYEAVFDCLDSTPTALRSVDLIGCLA
jgi:glycosyltransferase involved in cell wall biosynthesis